jgi:hypothetical protein
MSQKPRRKPVKLTVSNADSRRLRILEKRNPAKEANVANTPRVGEKAPAFELLDSAGKKRTLDELLVTRNVMLVFFRGLW